MAPPSFKMLWAESLPRKTMACNLRLVACILRLVACSLQLAACRLQESLPTKTMADGAEIVLIAGFKLRFLSQKLHTTRYKLTS